MPPKVALLAFFLFTYLLFRIERKLNPWASIALWIPTIWLLIMGSRPVGAWLNPAAEGGSDLEGSAADRLVLNILIFLGIWVLSRRKVDWNHLIKQNGCLILLYLYLFASIFWSEFFFSSFKRWFKISGTIVMALIIYSEKKPFQALESILRRAAYILIPLSLVLIKYFPVYGIRYTPWEGTRMGTGVTTHKNSLGILCMLLAFTIFWSILQRWHSKKLFKNKQALIADSFVLCIAIYLLTGGGGGYSATSLLIFSLSVVTLLILPLLRKLHTFIATHFEFSLLLLILLVMFFYTTLLPIITSALGRNETLTGRSDIWTTVIEVADRNPILGTGYGGYWGLVANAYSYHHGVKQSHNGYLDVYLQVGWLGIFMLLAFLKEFFKKVQKTLKFSRKIGIFGTCFVLQLLIYNYSEAAFIQASLMWTVTIFIAIILSNADNYLYVRKYCNQMNLMRNQTYKKYEKLKEVYYQPK